MIRSLQFITAMGLMLCVFNIAEAKDPIELKLKLLGHCSEFINQNFNNFKSFKAATLTRHEAMIYGLRSHPNYSPFEQMMMKSVITAIYRNMNLESVQAACVKAGLKYDGDGSKTAAYEKTRLLEEEQRQIEEGRRQEELNKKANDEVEDTLKKYYPDDKKDQESEDKEKSQIITPEPLEDR